MNTGPERQQAEGTWDKIKGNVKESVGGALQDHKMQAEGLADQAKGEAKQKIGEAREGVSDHLSDTGVRQQAAGVWDKVAGKVKEEWGDLTDDASLEARGKAQQAGGHVEKAVGDAASGLSNRT